MKELVLHHKQKVVDGIHISHSFEYADAASRLAASGFVDLDLNKLALQLDNKTMWMLTSVAPIAWQLISFPVVAQEQLESVASNPSFGKVSANGSLVVAGSDGDVLRLGVGGGLALSADAGNKSIQFSLDSDFVTRVNSVRRLVQGTNIVLTEQGTNELVISASGGGGTGVTAHGALTGLNFDHHLHYLNETRHQEIGRHQLIVIDPLTDEPWRDPVTGKISGCIPHDDLNGLTNVKIANLLAKQVLTFNGGYWQNMSLPLATSLQDGLMSKEDKNTLIALGDGAVSSHASNHYMTGGTDLIPVATTTRNGLMSKTDKIALNNLVSNSDGRLKKNVEKVADAVDVMFILRQMDAVYFNWDTSQPRAAGYGDQREIGFIAQQIEGIMPEVVGDDGLGYMTLDYAKMVPMLVEAIKVQQKQIDELKWLSKRKK